MTDEELDRDWKPNGRRPQSTIARSFSQELGDIFRIENSVADLDEQVDKRKQHVFSQTTELEALEARIREMEAMLKKSAQSGGRRTVSGGSGPSGSASASGPSASSASSANATTNNLPSPTSPRNARPSLNGAFADPNAIAPADASRTPRPLEHRQRQQQQPQQHSTQPDANQKYGGSRPGTARASQQAVPGALPPTPVGSEDGDTERY